MKFDDKVAKEPPGSQPTEDIVLQFSAGAVVPGGTQTITVYGPGVPNAIGPATTVLPSVNQQFYIGGAITLANSAVHVWAGPREDPFFFDLGQYYKMFPDRNPHAATKTSCLPTPIGDGSCPLGFNASGTDTPYGTPGVTANVNFAGPGNVLSIVAEMPASFFQQNGGIVAYWATTSTANGL
jgi:hypothetical protein